MEEGNERLAMLRGETSLFVCCLFFLVRVVFLISYEGEGSETPDVQIIRQFV